MVFVDKKGNELHPGDYITWFPKKRGQAVGHIVTLTYIEGSTFPGVTHPGEKYKIEGPNAYVNIAYEDGSKSTASIKIAGVEKYSQK
jgi:hypothetical protein